MLAHLKSITHSHSLLDPHWYSFTLSLYYTHMDLQINSRLHPNWFLFKPLLCYTHRDAHSTHTHTYILLHIPNMCLLSYSCKHSDIHLNFYFLEDPGKARGFSINCHYWVRIVLLNTAAALKGKSNDKMTENTLNRIRTCQIRKEFMNA